MGWSVLGPTHNRNFLGTFELVNPAGVRNRKFCWCDILSCYSVSAVRNVASTSGD